MSNEVSDLRECPLCNDYAAVWPDNEPESAGYEVGCSTCGCNVHGDTEAEAIAAWNRRSPSPRIETRASEDDGVSYAGKVHAAEAPMANAIDDVKAVAFWDIEEFKIWRGIDPKSPVWASRGLCCSTWVAAADLMDDLYHNDRSLILRVAPNKNVASPAPSQHTGWSDEAVDRPLLLEAIKGLMLLKDLFDSSDGTPADAYHILAKQDGTWGNARTALTAASSIAPATGFEVPDNLVSHRASWLKALDRLIELEPESYQPDMDEKGYWRHERQAMMDMYADFDRRIRSSISPSVAKESGEPS